MNDEIADVLVSIIDDKLVIAATTPTARVAIRIQEGEAVKLRISVDEYLHHMEIRHEDQLRGRAQGAAAKASAR